MIAAGKGTRVSQRLRMHATGLIYIGMIFVIAMVAMNTQNNLLFWAFGILLAGLLLSIGVSRLMLSGLTVRRLDPSYGAVGEPLVVRYEFRNRRRWLPVFSMHCAELPVDERATNGRSLLRRGRSDARNGVDRRARPWQRMLAPASAWVMHIAGRETTHADSVYWPTQRGLIRFHRLRLWTTFPMGIIRRTLTMSQAHHTLVFPRLYMLRPELLERFMPVGVIGMRMSQRPGKGEEYYGVREYREGDSMRHISWKRTARTDELVTIERSRPSPPKLRVVLNLLRTTDELRLADDSTQAKRDAEERAISLAASILHAADSTGYEVGLSVLGFDIPRMPLRRSRWHLGKMLAALAALDLDATRQPRSRGAVPDAERAGLVMVHPDRVDPSLGRDDVWHLTSAQLESITTGVLGWEPSRMRPSPGGIDVIDATSLPRAGASREAAA